MVSMEREGVRVAGFLAGVDAGALVTHWSRDSRRASSAAWSWAESVERRASQAEAEAGMELMEVPPEIEPMLRVVRGACAFGAAGSLGRDSSASRARARMRMGLGAPASEIGRASCRERP